MLASRIAELVDCHPILITTKREGVIVRKLAMVFVGCLGLFIGYKLYAEMSVVEEEDPNFGPNPETYDRFACDCNGVPCDCPEFRAAGLNWSGIGREVEIEEESELVLSSRWATLISSSFYLTANHHAPFKGNALIFHYSNMKSDALMVWISDSQQDQWALFPAPPPDRDLHMGRLDGPVSNTLWSYPIVIFDDPIYYFTLLFEMFGIAGNDNFDPSAQKVAFNVPQIGQVNTNERWYGYQYFTGQAPRGMGRDFDSGGPSLTRIVVGEVEKPALMGIHWGGRAGTANNPDVSNGHIGEDSAVGMYRSDIVSIMNNAQSGVSIELRENPIFYSVKGSPFGHFNGDLDGDFSLSFGDIDIALREAYQRALQLPRAYNWALDLDDDGDIDIDDAAYIVEDLMGTAFGDLNLDGYVDDDDFDQMLLFFNEPVLEILPSWFQGDLNGDGMVDLSDFAILDANHPFP